MSITSEIERLQTAKETLKTKLNAKNDSEHQITDELISEYGNFVDNISTGVDINEYYDLTLDVNKNFTGYIKQIPMIDTSYYTAMDQMFFGYTNLTTIPQLNTSNVSDTESMFENCSNLTTIPQLNTSNLKFMKRMFWWCNNLTTIPQLDTSKVMDISNAFYSCFSLENLGGFLNIGQAYSTTQSANLSVCTLDFSTCPNLTHDSLMNVINGLYDIATKGCNSQQLVLGDTNIAKLTAEEIAIATEKGWTVS